LILILAISEIGGSTSPPKTESAPTDKFIDADAYAEVLEERLLRIVSEIEGVGDAEILVTVGSTERYIYAKEGKTSNSGSQNEIVIIDSGGGDAALTESVTRPEVTGVVIVCEGGDDARVAEKVVMAVKTALGIGASKIYVTERTEEELSNEKTHNYNRQKAYNSCLSDPDFRHRDLHQLRIRLGRNGRHCR
jgi:stage III sporulation protein AG